MGLEKYYEIVKYYKAKIGWIDFTSKKVKYIMRTKEFCIRKKLRILAQFYDHPMVVYQNNLFQREYEIKLHLEMHLLIL